MLQASCVHALTHLIAYISCPRPSLSRDYVQPSEEMRQQKWIVPHRQRKCAFWTLHCYSDPDTIFMYNWTMNCSFTACGHDCCNNYFKVKLYSFAWVTGEAEMSEAIPKTNRSLSSITLSQDTGFRSLTLYFHLSSYVSLHNEIESISL